MQHLNIRVTGRVQGVSFRYYTQLTAEKMGIAGFITNESDGSVYLEAEGTKNQLREFLKWLKQGPRWAVVERVEVAKGQMQHYTVFSIENPLLSGRVALWKPRNTPLPKPKEKPQRNKRTEPKNNEHK